MSDLFVPVKLSLRTHPKLRSLAKRLGGKAIAVGTLSGLWMHALEHYADGVISDDHEELADACWWDGCPDELAAHLTESGWLSACEGGYRLHGWAEAAGKYLERRVKERERKRESRASADTSTDVRGTSADSPRTGRGQSAGGGLDCPQQTEQNRTEQNETKQNRTEQNQRTGILKGTDLERLVSSWSWSVQVTTNHASKLKRITGKHGSIPEALAVEAKAVVEAKEPRPRDPVAYWLTVCGHKLDEGWVEKPPEPEPIPLEAYPRAKYQLRKLGCEDLIPWMSDGRLPWLYAKSDDRWVDGACQLVAKYAEQMRRQPEDHERWRNLRWELEALQ